MTQQRYTADQRKIIEKVLQTGTENNMPYAAIAEKLNSTEGLQKTTGGKFTERDINNFIRLWTNKAKSAGRRGKAHTAAAKGTVTAATSGMKARGRKGTVQAVSGNFQEEFSPDAVKLINDVLSTKGLALSKRRAMVEIALS